MMRLTRLLCAFLLLAQPASAATSTAFGGSGTPRFMAFSPPSDLTGANRAGEPSIGIPWNTDHAFFQAGATTFKIVLDDVAGTAAWTVVSPAFTSVNVDPMLHADHVSNRVWAGGLDGPCSIMGLSDDDGATWTPTGNVCNFAQFDHQSIGSGPWAGGSLPRGAVYSRATYYCSQLQLGTPVGNSPGTACVTSLNGGQAWLPPVEVLGGCGGLHGHIRVSEVTGTAVLPDGSCDSGEGSPPGGVVTTGTSRVGFAYTADNGQTWGSRVIPGSVSGNGFDPSADFSRQSGWLYYAQADDLGLHVALMKNGNFESLGGAMAGVEPSLWLNLSSAYHDPRTGAPLKFGTFADVTVGDDLRADVSFLGATAGSHPFDDCSSASDEVIWHPYLAQTFDGGASWNVTRLSEDPIQVGAIWGGGGSQPCRNLLDFADADMDSHGRLDIALADGCRAACVEKYDAWMAGKGDAPKGTDSRTRYATILHQVTGRGLFSRFDNETSLGPGATPTNESPGIGPLVTLVLLAALAVAVRRRRSV